MAYPVVLSTNTSTVTSSGTSHTVSLPSGISSGNLLLVLFTSFTSFNTTHSTPSGWTKKFTIYNTHAEVNMSLYSKIAGSSEGSTVNITTGNSGTSAHVSLHISNTTGEIEYTTAANSDDFPSVTPSWGIDDYMWICGVGYFQEAITDPSGYSNGVQANSTNCRCRITRKNARATSEDPGTINRVRALVTIAVRPSSNTTDFFQFF